MKLSVIIVNYNVRAYLEQCLRAVVEAMKGIDGDVFVVDNQSTDGSVEMVQAKFPGVRLIANQVNVGFSRANNQAIRESTAEYVVLLNPDTVVGEDVFEKVLAFMDAHPKAGGLGVRMIDGTGRFLPESKRGLPTPSVAFYKIIGLTRLFPRSKVFGRYHLGHLAEDRAAPIEILSGACMFMRKRTLDEVGLLDESFFMYGEDIDLSYRITLGGYENWYFPQAHIIHYKGESTKKSSVNYVFVFYNAMAIFAQKHFARSGGVFPALIKGSIYLSAAAAIATRFLNRALLPFLDLLTIVLVLALSPVVPQRWPFIQELGTDLVIGLGVVGWTALFGGYDRPLRFLPPVKALLALLAVGGSLWWSLSGTAEDILETALLCTWATAAMLFVRLVLHLLRIRGYGLRRKERERILAIGSKEEARHALALLWQTHFGLGWSSTISPGTPNTTPEALARTIRKHRVGEVVFCAKDLSWGGIITMMEQLRKSGAEFKIAQPAREFIIGPSSIESLADLYVLQEHALITPGGRRAKRILDVVVSALMLLLAPLVALTFPKGANRLGDAVEVLAGKRSWVGYLPTSRRALRLPSLLPGVFNLAIEQANAPTERVSVRMNALYAKDYEPFKDLRLVWRGLLSKH
jgi:GT2 family glycosyltransferase